MAPPTCSVRAGRSTSSLSRRLEKSQKSFSPQLQKSPNKTQRTSRQQPTPAKRTRPSPPRMNSTSRDLALTKDASDIEYRELVEYVFFKSKANVKSVSAELAANLKVQGWTKEGSDLVTPSSSILKRKRGDAELTIFVKPESGGSKVKMLTDGLAWDEE